MALLKRQVAALLISLVLQFACPAHARNKPCIEPKSATDSKFHPGQVWEYNTRSHEKGSTLTILKVESVPTGVIIHIRVDKVRLRNCTGGPEPNKFEHMPFSREAIERSVTKLLKEGSTPDFQEGYAEWRRACGGVYTISVAEAVAVAEKTFREGLGCSSLPDA